MSTTVLYTYLTLHNNTAIFYFHPIKSLRL